MVLFLAARTSILVTKKYIKELMEYNKLNLKKKNAQICNLQLFCKILKPSTSLAVVCGRFFANVHS